MSGTLPLAKNAPASVSMIVCVLRGSAATFVSVEGVAPLSEPSPIAVPWSIVTMFATTPGSMVVTSACAVAPPASGAGPVPASVTVASTEPASDGPSQVMTRVEVEVDGSHEAPLGTAPSPAVTVTVTWPGAVQVNEVDDALGAEKVPLGADHA